MKSLIQKNDAATKNIWDFLFAFIAGFVPLTWFSSGHILNSVDLRFPYNAHQWKSLLYVWNDGFNVGAENILDNCLIPFMGLSAFLQGLGLSLIATQKVLFVFWFMLPGLTMAVLLRTVFPGSSATLFRLCALSFYMFNLWLEHSWIGFKPPILSAYAWVPLMLALIIKTLKGDLKLFTGLSLFVFSAFFASAIGNNSSELVASLAPLPILFLYFFIKGKTWRNWGLFKRLSGFILLFAGAWLLGSFYWFVPQATAILRLIFLKLNSQMPTMWEITNWLNGLSISTSFFNVIRMQADWVWYQGCVDPYRTYSTFYHNSPLMFGLSLTLPLIVLLGLFNKNVRYRGFFMTLLFAGIFLSMGAHAPTGPVYMWMTEHIPLFWIFRSPYLKFFFWCCLAYSVFFGAGCVLIYRFLLWGLQKLRFIPVNARMLSIAAGALFCAFNLVYAFPVTTGKFFTKPEERTFLPPDHIVIPGYVEEAGEWLNAQKGFFRFYSLPGDNPSIYNWGGVHFGSVLKEKTIKPLAFGFSPQNTLISQGASNPSFELLSLIRDQIYNERTEWASDLLALMNVKYLLQEKDIRYDFYKGPSFVEGDDPEFVAGKIAKQKGLIPSEAFGEWQFYRLEKELPAVYGAAKGYRLNGPVNLFTWLTYYPFPERPAFFSARNEAFNETDLPRIESFPGKNGIYSVPGQPGSKLVVQTDQLNSRIDLQNSVNKELRKSFKVDLNYTEFNKPEFRDGATWMWWAGNLDDIKLYNNSGETKRVSFFVKVMSLEIQREFYVHLGKKLLDHPVVPPNEDTELLYKEFDVPPGEHRITFYSPTRNSWRNGKGMSFSIEKESLAFGMLSFELPFRIPGEENYTIRIFPKTGHSVQNGPKYIFVDGDKVKLNLKKDLRKLYFEAAVPLSEGNHTLRLDQINGENYFIEIYKDSGSLAIPSADPKIDVIESSPAKHRLRVDAASPFYLVFNQSYHPMWKATAKINGKNHSFKAHAKVNGFANGYYIDQAGQYELALEFTPQRLFDFSMLVTLLGLFGALACLFVTFSRKTDLLSSAEKKDQQHQNQGTAKKYARNS